MSPPPSDASAARHRLIAALDTGDRRQAACWADAIGPECGLLKIGLEFFVAHGPSGVAELDPARIFLDLKLHDIPATVRGAARAAASLRPAMLTVHASGGATMIAAAREALEIASSGGRRPKLLAVTVLTSLDAAALHELGVAGGPRQQVLRLGRLAMESGADGLVCSAHEAAGLRTMLGPDACLVVPAIRPAGEASYDQARVMTPGEAIAAGADWIVVGRPITSSPDPARAARAIVQSIAAAVG